MSVNQSLATYIVSTNESRLQWKWSCYWVFRTFFLLLATYLVYELKKKSAPATVWLLLSFLNFFSVSTKVSCVFAGDQSHFTKRVALFGLHRLRRMRAAKRWIAFNFMRWLRHFVPYLLYGTEIGLCAPWHLEVQMVRNFYEILPTPNELSAR